MGKMKNWTEKQWKLVGECLSRGIVPGATVKDVFDGREQVVASLDKWDPDHNGSGFVYCGGALMGKGHSDDYATVIKCLGAKDEARSLSGKEVSVTIDGKTYTAIIK